VIPSPHRGFPTATPGGSTRTQIEWRERSSPAQAREPRPRSGSKRTPLANRSVTRARRIHKSRLQRGGRRVSERRPGGRRTRRCAERDPAAEPLGIVAAAVHRDQMGEASGERRRRQKAIVNSWIMDDVGPRCEDRAPASSEGAEATADARGGQLLDGHASGSSRGPSPPSPSAADETEGRRRCGRLTLPRCATHPLGSAGSSDSMTHAR